VCVPSTIDGLSRTPANQTAQPMFNSFESCDFSCPGDSSFYGEDVIPNNNFYECDIKFSQQQQQQQQQQQLSNGSVFGRTPINEPTVNFGNGSFYNAPSQRSQPFVGAFLGSNISSGGMQRYHPYHQQQNQDAFYHQRDARYTYLIILSTHPLYKLDSEWVPL